MLFSGCDRDITRVVESEDQPLVCFDCHSDQNTFIVAAYEQWKNSVHASSLNIDRGSSSSCAACHISEGFVQRTKGEEVTGNPNPTPIHCFTCHAPHTNGDFSLRWKQLATLESGATYDLGAGNLCVACHHARRDVETYVSGPSVEINSTHWGPHHSVQGDNLLGMNGYMYDGYDYEITPHRSATRDGCIDCHFNTTSNSVVGGHSFNMEFELRLEGGEEEEVLNTAACEICHGELDDFDYRGVQTSADLMASQLEGLLTTAGLLVDGHPNDEATTSADSAGALWNYLMYHEDRSHGIHNPKHLMGLLQSSIMFLQGSLTSPATAAREQYPWDEQVMNQ
jgi:hypothetical protein